MVTTEQNMQFSPTLITSRMNSSLDKLASADPGLFLAAREQSVMEGITLPVHFSKEKHFFQPVKTVSSLIGNHSKVNFSILAAKEFRTHLTADPKLTIQGELSSLEMGRDVQDSRIKIKAEPKMGVFIFQAPLPAFLQHLFDHNSSLGRVASWWEPPNLQRPLTFFFSVPFYLSNDFQLQPAVLRNHKCHKSP